jgi:16S rRNA G966 N2-methylase RsmD
MKRKIYDLYKKPFPASRNGPLYNAFSYSTKISPEAIALFIATHTTPGATILDAFGGSGTTGLAALLCDRPTAAMSKLAVEMGVEPKWGPRHAHLYEVGTLGSFVSQTMCNPPSSAAFSKAVEKLCCQAEKKIGWIYGAYDESGQKGVIRHSIWSDVLLCNHCNSETTYWDAAIRREPLSISETFTCSSCSDEIKISDCSRAFETTPDCFGVETEQKKRVLVRVYGATGKAKWQRNPTQKDFDLISKVNCTTLPKGAPNEEIVWGDLRRSGYHKGIKKLHHFYTRRNFLAVATLWDLASDFPSDVRDALRLLILSYNSTHSTLMTRVVVKKSQKDLVLTGSQSGVLYISGMPVEKNVILGIARKAKTFSSAFSLVSESRSRVTVHNTSSETINLPDSSIDYVFTDPPFGAYIPYAEINQINEIWLGSTTSRESEAIVSDAQGKDVSAYADIMATIFSEFTRVLKPEGMATVVFHSAHAEIWRALVDAYTKAGLSVKATSVLDKIQSSFKQVVSKVSVKGDPLLLLTKEREVIISGQTARSVAVEMIEKSCELEQSNQEPQRIFSRFIARCLKMGIIVDMDARDFYAMVKDHIGEQG